MIKEVDLENLFKYLLKLKTEGFTGKVQLNFFNGGITNINIGNEPPIWVEKSVKIGTRE